MKRTELWQVTVEPTCGGEWEGSFLNQPTPSDLYAAILDDIKENSEAEQDANADESDQEVLFMEMERLRLVSEVSDHAVNNFATQHGWQQVVVAGTEVGRILVITNRVFVQGE